MKNESIIDFLKNLSPLEISELIIIFEKTFGVKQVSNDFKTIKKPKYFITINNKYNKKLISNKK